MKVTKVYAYKVLEDYEGNMYRDDILVNYILENPTDTEYINKLKENAPNVFMLLNNIKRRSQADSI